MKLYEVTVEKDLEDLIPIFLTNRKKDIASLREAIATQDFEIVRIIGHNMKGFGSSYGFGYVSEMGFLLETAAKSKDENVIIESIDQLEDFFNSVKISYE